MCFLELLTLTTVLCLRPMKTMGKYVSSIINALLKHSLWHCNLKECLFT